MDETDFARARETMVREQLEARDIVDRRVLDAMRRVPRHLFVPEENRASAYEDRALPIGEEQTISQPYMVALMAQMLMLTGAERLLEVGAGSGYGAAVLSALAHEVVTIERHPGLAERAQATLAKLEVRNATVVIGDGTLGWGEEPFDRILVAAAWRRVPGALTDQLACGGRLIMPVGEQGVQTLTVVTKDAQGRTFTHEHGSCAFVPLIGAQGHPG
jgi:protein-L-isoaspartate(D-aspartate) O-methyltransferase